jgi:mannosyl-3-phosphoglycerate phosphatase
MMKLVVFTDLDATLLDAETYSWHAAGTALDALKRREDPVVLVSSKTLAEMAPIHQELGLSDPFVIENGGGIVSRREAAITSLLIKGHIRYPCRTHADLAVLPMGAQYEHLVSALEGIGSEVGCTLVGFSAMSNEEVARLTGLGIEDAARARLRDFDEPFVVRGQGEPEKSRIENGAARRGLTAVEGGRFWHLMGHRGKGEAVSVLIEAFRRLHGTIRTVGLGDSPNDFPFLELVDIPVVVGRDRHDFVLPSPLRGRTRTSGPGPEGWNEAMLRILAELESLPLEE